MREAPLKLEHTAFLEKRPGLALLTAITVLLVLVSGMFVDVIISPNRVLSWERTDLSRQFVAWRAFGFGELKRGNLALWNPHIYGGAPFLGGMQSALFYPPNLLFLFLPLTAALNVSIAMHVFLLGLFMYLWARGRGLCLEAAILSAAIIMFGGAHFLHIMAGHLANLCTMTWAPLVFLAIDGLIRRPSPRWIFLGSLAVSMQILAGHPQYVFYTGVAALIYVGLRLIKADNRKGVMLCLLAIYASAAALCAIQLLPAMQAHGESIRGHGLPFEFASRFSFPPESFLTLLAPNFFGDGVRETYWGRYYLWEMSLFVGVTGLVLAIYGAVRGEAKQRLFSVVMVAVLLLLALGVHTPLFRVLYDFVPGFDKFRSISKFGFEASLFLALLAGVGLHTLIQRGQISTKVVLALVAVAACVSVAAVMISQAGEPGTWWHKTMQSVRDTGESYLSSPIYDKASFVRKATRGAAQKLFITASTLLLVALLLYLCRSSRRFVHVVALVAVVELFVFARTSRPTFDIRHVTDPQPTDSIMAQLPDSRVLDLDEPNRGMLVNANDVWGFDPGVSRRYAELVAHAQGGNPDRATQFAKFTEFRKSDRGVEWAEKLSPVDAMLRLGYVIVRSKEGRRAFAAPNRPMPRLQLVYDYRVIPLRDDIFRALDDPAFDPRRTVILETEPGIAVKQPEQRGEVRLIDSSSDSLTIDVNLPTPAILLVTDAYSAGWRATRLTGSSGGANIRILPANYAFQAIPLEAGAYRFRMEFLPTEYVIGKWVSLISVVFLLGLITWYLAHRMSFKAKPLSAERCVD